MGVAGRRARPGFAGLSMSHLRGMLESHQKSSTDGAAVVIEPVTTSRSRTTSSDPQPLWQTSITWTRTEPHQNEVRSPPSSYTITTRLPAVFANVVALLCARSLKE